MLIESGDQIENNINYEFDTPVTYRYSEKVSTEIIELRPNKKQMIEGLNELFMEAVDSIQVVDRWAKN